MRISRITAHNSTVFSDWQAVNGDNYAAADDDDHDDDDDVQVQPQQRDYAKQLAYGLLYGKGAHALAVDLSCDVKRAAAHHESFLKSIPDVVSHSAGCSSRHHALCPKRVCIPKFLQASDVHSQQQNKVIQQR